VSPPYLEYMTGHGGVLGRDGEPELHQVLLDVEDGQDGIVYGPGPRFEVLELLFVPAWLLQLSEEG